MEVNRREFQLVILAAASVLTTDGSGADPVPATGTAPSGAAGEPVDAGPIGNFSSQGAYADFRQQGFFVIRRDKKVFALSAVCTHKGCKVRVEEDQSFYCKCHGSTFDRDGRVTEGPATRNLPRLAVKLDEREHVLVDPAQKIETSG